MKKVSDLLKAPSFAASQELRDLSDWSLGPVGRHRESDSLERSNWRVVLADIAKTDPTGEDYRVERFGHWAVGWVEELLTRPGSAAEKCAEEWEAALADYPVADDTDLSEEEMEEAFETWAQCYSDRSRLEYIRDNWSQFGQCHAEYGCGSTPDEKALDAWRTLLANVRGTEFHGYASELIH